MTANERQRSPAKTRVHVQRLAITNVALPAHSEDLPFLEDDDVVTFDVDWLEFVAAIVNDVVTDFDCEGDSGSVLEVSVTDGEDGSLGGLFLGDVGEKDAALGFAGGRGREDDDVVVEGREREGGSWCGRRGLA